MSVISTSQKQQQPQMKALELVAQHKKQAEVGTLLSRRYGQLLRSEKHTDCIFHICEQRLKCHKLILSAASPVFEAMFYGPLQENEPQIEIHDISAEIFKVLIEYIYTGSVDYECLQLEACIELYYAAEKYLLDQLISGSLLAVTHKLRFCNILPALELGVCMNLDSLLDVCMTFFMRCCVSNAQYMSYLKEHYVHVSKECVKAIITACKEPHKLLLWYVYEWTQQECMELGLTPSDADLVVHELELGAPAWQAATTKALSSTADNSSSTATLVERCYYKACRPFTVDSQTNIWRLRLKSSRFISMLGLVLHSRLTPNLNCTISHGPRQQLLEYRESLRIDVYELPSGGNAVNVDNVVWTHVVQSQTTKYNCDLHLSWTREQDCVLAPDVIYELRLRWDSNAFGAEYPCSLQSSKIDGIQFIDDGDSFSGSLVKGLRYVNLV
ncbi:BTB/POZ domain-containing protein 9 [Scaptodrosophila lebanonensis]|uniref:BTB/POZ domain-containing protein 9 n=1 Tax=Drosophila lebanonensis TaxID=7225 RepID=A0A6J2UJD1_DROLE|nr:BTB/POZ domain-containing protein 9 [Scaptodrosophila lebanonensis]